MNNGHRKLEWADGNGNNTTEAETNAVTRTQLPGLWAHGGACGYAGLDKSDNGTEAEEREANALLHVQLPGLWADGGAGGNTGLSGHGNSNSASLQIENRTRTLHCHARSYLGFGLMAARAATLDWGETAAANPCVPLDHTGIFEYGGKQHNLVAAKTGCASAG